MEPVNPSENTNLVSEAMSSLDTSIVSQEDLAAQVIDLQMTVAHLELSLEQLDRVIAKQDQHIQNMQRQLQMIYNHVENNQAEGGIAPFDVIADKPPHY